MQTRLTEGLERDEQELACIPSYLSPKTPAQPETILTFDLGGTSLRAAFVNMAAGGRGTCLVGRSYRREMRTLRNPGSHARHFFAEHAEILPVNLSGRYPIGYCFSFPITPTPDGDARLIRWTKGVTITKMEGNYVGRSLKKYLERHFPAARFTRIRVVNDATATLHAAVTLHPADTHIAVILGTGFNIAAMIPAYRIPKLPPVRHVQTALPVNIEAGNLLVPCLTHYDDIVDMISVNPNAQRLEKAVSGAYLGRLFSARHPINPFNEEVTARHLTRIICAPDRFEPSQVETARELYRRSTQLSAAALAGVVAFLTEGQDDLHRVCIAAEGSLADSAAGEVGEYRVLLHDALRTILDKTGLKQVQFEIVKIANANLLGAALSTAI